MIPELFKIGTFPVRSFGLLMVIAFFTAIWLVSKRAPRHGLKVEQVQDASFWIIVFGVIGARLAFILTNLPHYLANTQELFSIRMEGLTSFGGLILGGAALWVISRRKKMPIMAFLDTVGIPVLVAHAIGRIGCLLNGCCYGFRCWTSPPGVHVHNLDGVWHPAQLYDSAMVLLGVAVLTRLEKRFTKQGTSFGWILIIYGVSRFIDEFWRIGGSSVKLSGSPLSLAQWVSILTVAIGVAFVVRARPVQESAIESTEA